MNMTPSSPGGPALNKIGVDDYYQKVFEPVFFEVHSDVAYAVFPVKGWFKQNGRTQVEALYLTTTSAAAAGAHLAHHNT